LPERKSSGLARMSARTLVNPETRESMMFPMNQLLPWTLV
jgi:hypothetical protein